MKRTQKNALAMAGLMTAATLFSAVPAMADDVITVDFWTAPQQVQYNYWEEKAQAFNETKTEPDLFGFGTHDVLQMSKYVVFLHHMQYYLLVYHFCFWKWYNSV